MSRSGGTSTVPRRVRAAEREPEAVVTKDASLPLASIALTLVDNCDSGDLICIVDDERRAEEIGRIVSLLAPTREVLVFPPWDCLPFDRASPSRNSMGRRMAVLQSLSRPMDSPRLVITTVEAALQKIPPIDRVAAVTFKVAEGEAFDIDALHTFGKTAGYALTDQVTEPGDIDFHGQVIEAYPPGLGSPVRIEVAHGCVAAIHLFNPATQRSTGTTTMVEFGPASELLPEADSEGERSGGSEHRLPFFYPAPLPSLFDCMPGATILATPGTAGRRSAFWEQLTEADATRISSVSGKGFRAPDWNRLYIDQASWDAIAEHHQEHYIDNTPWLPVPRFSQEAKPAHAFQSYLEEHIGRGGTLLLAGVRRDLESFSRHLERHGGRTPEQAADWAAVTQAAQGAFLSIELDLDEGVVDKKRGLAVVAAADVLGTRVHHADEPHANVQTLMARPVMKIGDTVIHEDHGVGVLRGLSTVEVDGKPRDAVRLGFHDEASLLVPVEDLDRVWRYGSDEDSVSLDRLHTNAWLKRRIDLERSVIATAKHLVAMAEEKQSHAAPKLEAAERTIGKFAARFAYPLTPDQMRAIAAVTEDLASGHAMDRLVCGDVGFGKTEVALRAAAIAMMAGKQVALVAPTTVLARQHLDVFRKRFAGFGFEIVGLSRLDSGAEARRVKEGLADGSIRMVIGTHAVAGSGVTFHDLGLLIIDEEQKFGSKLKASLRSMGSAGHVLTLTATPIPRTLQMALVGVQTVSVIATPPTRRQPIRTFVVEYDAVATRVALLREHARGGQSFMIVPRIEDIGKLRAKLKDLVPELEVLVAHGELSAEDADQAMVEFGNGRADVLLATNIVESGLDVPRANTMLVWDAGRFGLSQLHQLRGRVGRGRTQGVAYLLTDPEAPASEATRTRLTTLEHFDRLGAGFAISARDLDLRGAGDLVGDEQAGHLKLIGLELYQNLLARAVRKAKGEAIDDAARPELHLDRVGCLPDTYIAEPDLRIELYWRLSRLETSRGIRAFRAEVEDRFGILPPEAEVLFVLARLSVECRHLHAASLSVGPLGAALTLRPEGLDHCRTLAEQKADLTLKGSKLVWSHPASDEVQAIGVAEAFLDLIVSARTQP